MKIESEKLVDRKLGEAVKQLNGLYIKLSTLHLLGLPDRLCLLPGGRIFFAEIKTTGKNPTTLQRLMLRRIEDLGFRVYVIDKSEQIKTILI
jgi:hypothetical protein